MYTLHSVVVLDVLVRVTREHLVVTVHVTSHCVILTYMVHIILYMHVNILMEASP
jgi:hypothetical protein